MYKRKHKRAIPQYFVSQKPRHITHQLLRITHAYSMEKEKKKKNNERVYSLDA